MDLPHSDEAERAVLGGVLLDGSAFSAVSKIVTAEDFFRPSNAQIYRVIQRLAGEAAPLETLSVLQQLTRSGSLEAVGGAAHIASLTEGIPKAANVAYFAGVVADVARRRRIAGAAGRLSEAACNGHTDEDLDGYLRDIRELRNPRNGLECAPSTFEDIHDPAVGDVSYLLAPMIPANDITIIGAEWKTAKTLIAYHMVLCACTGTPIFGVYPVEAPLRVMVLQFEMPPREDSRRFRRLALAAGIDLSLIPSLVREGRLLLYNRPPFRLVTPQDVSRFHELVAEGRPQLVFVDSILAAFAGEDLNNNSVVRGLMAQAFAPLTSDGISVLASHHKRKSQAGGKDPEKDSLLGAQAFGATAGRIYSLERLSVDERKDGTRDFKVRLGLTGSWTPEGFSDIVLSVEDTSKEATTIRVVPEGEQIRAGGYTSPQKTAIAMVNLLKVHRRMPRKAVFEMVGKDLSVKKRSLEAGLKYARKQEWIDSVSSEIGTKNQQDLVLGRLGDGDL